MSKVRSAGSLLVALCMSAAWSCDEATCTPECSAGERCVGGRCRLGCTSDAGCPPGYLCFESFCEEGNRRPGAGGGDYQGGDITTPGDTAVPANCGDGVRGVGELCDGSDLGLASDCASLGYSGTTIGCLPSCQHYDLSACTFAGGSCNGAKAQGGEQCDGADLRNETCQTLGFSGGDLACTADCTFDLSVCN